MSFILVEKKLNGINMLLALIIGKDKNVIQRKNEKNVKLFVYNLIYISL